MYPFAEQTAQSGRRDRSLTARNCGLLYAENMSSVGRAGSACGVPASMVELPLDAFGLRVMSLIASSACNTPITPTTGPRMPPSPQLKMLSAGGGLGNIHL